MSEKTEKAEKAEPEKKRKGGFAAEEFSPEAVECWKRLSKLYNQTELGEQMGISHRTGESWVERGNGVPERHVDKFVAVTGVPLELVRPDVAAKRKKAAQEKAHAAREKAKAERKEAAQALIDSRARAPDA